MANPIYQVDHKNYWLKMDFHRILYSVYGVILDTLCDNNLEFKNPRRNP